MEATDGGADVAKKGQLGVMPKGAAFWKQFGGGGAGHHRSATVRLTTNSGKDILKHSSCYAIDRFDACTCRCRADSQMLLHENSYKTREHFCFHAKPPKLPEPAFAIGKDGESCATTCSTIGLECDEASLFQLNCARIYMLTLEIAGVRKQGLATVPLCRRKANVSLTMICVLSAALVADRGMRRFCTCR